MSAPNKTRIQVATDAGFSGLIKDVNGAYTTAIAIAENELPKEVNLYARAMHGHPVTGDSAWSAVIQFVIASSWSEYDGSANGADITVASTVSNRLAATALTSTKILIVYEDGASLLAKVLNISGTTITTGSVKTIRAITEATTSLRISRISDTTALIAYSLGSADIGSVCILSVSGTTVTVGAAVIYDDEQSDNVDITVLSATRALLLHRNRNDDNRIVIWALNISGTTVTLGNNTRLNGTITASFNSIDRLSDTMAIAIFVSNGNSNRCIAKIITLVSNVLAVGTNTYLSAGTATGLKVVSLGDGVRALAFFSDAGIHRAMLLTVSGADVISGGEFIYSSAVINYIDAVLVDTNRVLVIYTNGSTSKPALAKVLWVNGNTVQQVATTVSVSGTKNALFNQVVNLVFGQIAGYVYLNQSNSQYVVAKVLAC